MSTNKKLLVNFVAMVAFASASFFVYANIHFWLPADNWNRRQANITPISNGLCHTQQGGPRGGASTRCFSTVSVEVNGVVQEMSWTDSREHEGPFEAEVWQHTETGELRRGPESSIAAKAIRVVLLPSIIIGLVYGFWQIIKIGRKQAPEQQL